MILSTNEKCVEKISEAITNNTFKIWIKSKNNQKVPYKIISIDSSSGIVELKLNFYN